jgi:hypothetical protein
MKKYIFSIVLLGSLVLAGCGKQEVPEPIPQEEPLIVEEEIPENPIQSFEDCLLAGFPVMESYPRQCNDGTTTYVEEIPLLSGNNETGSVITGDSWWKDVWNQDLPGQTGANVSGSKIDVIGEYIEKLREKKNEEAQQGIQGSSTAPQVQVNPDIPAKQPDIPPAAQGDTITEQDIENLEKIINEIVK